MSDVRITPLGRVLRAGDLGIYQDAIGALALARAEAGRLTAAAHEEIEAARSVAQTEAVKAGEAEVARALAALAIRTSHELAALRPALADAMADGVARILGSRPAPEIVAEAAAFAIGTLQDRAGLTVRVSPVHSAAVAAALAVPENDGPRVQADANLGEDECVIETASGFVRAGLRDQLERLREALRNAADEPAAPVA